MGISRQWSATVIALLCAIAMARTAAPPAVMSAEENTWQPLGPSDAGLMNQFRAQVSPAWPADQTVLANHHQWLIRSGDGGATWQWLPVRVPTRFWLTRSEHAQTLAFAMGYPDSAGQGTRLLRSMGALDTWESVMDLPQLRAGSLVDLVSPPAGGASMMLAYGDSAIYRTDDSGATWKALPLPAGPGAQRLTEVHVSPDFDSDRTVVIAMSGADSSTYPYMDPSTRAGSASLPPIPEKHLASAGLFISYDAGESWKRIGEGLQVNGVAYPHVQDLALSPTFSRDRTLYVWAWGPADRTVSHGEQHISVANALFVSNDAGATWNLAWDQPTLVNEISQEHVLRLAPASSGDRALAMVLRPPSVREYSKLGLKFEEGQPTCTVHRIERDGDRWRVEDAFATSIGNGGCGELKTLPAPHGERVVVVLGQYPRLGMGVYASDDHGITWSALGLPPNFGTGFPRGVSVDHRGSLIVSTERGLWAHGQPDPPWLPAPPSCPLPAGSALKTYKDEQELVSALGCAQGPEEVVTLRDRNLGTTRGLWLEDDSPIWFELRAHTPRTGARWFERSKAEHAWQGAPDEVAPAWVQRFWNGIAIRWQPSGSPEVAEIIKRSRPSSEPGAGYWSRKALP